MAISKVILNGATLIDTTDKTVTNNSMLLGVTALKNDGTTATGNIVSKSSTDLTVSGATVTAPAGYYSSSASKSVASGSAGTPTATKGTVSNNSISITPSVTNTTGYITGDTKTGTSVTVSASELVSGTKTISASGTTDVTNYKYASVADGSATTPSTSITANPTISVSSGGLITASVSGSKNVTPTVRAGYVLSGTAGTVSVSGSNTEQLATQAATTYHPSTTDQTIASGKYLTGAQTIKAVTTTNLTAANIADGVTVKIGDSTDDDCVASITGTHSGGYSSDTVGKLIMHTLRGAFELPSGITKIGTYAFYNCSNLTLPNGIPSTVTEIEGSAFAKCGNLVLSSLPNSITKIGASAFYGCMKIALSSLPSSLTQVGSTGFYNCPLLTISTLPSSLTQIGGSAFSGCAGIQTIACDGALTNIDASSFNGITNRTMILTDARFPNAVVSSLPSAFGNTTASRACQSLGIVDIGKTSSIAANAFANCYALQTLILRKTDAICSLANVSAFVNTPMRGYNSLTGTVYVPNDLISTYQTATNWSTLYNDGTVTFSKIEGSAYDLS